MTFTVVVHGQSISTYLQSIDIDTLLCTSFTGLLDDNFEFDMMLCDSVGAYKMKSSNDIYVIEIENINDGLELTEWYDKNQLTGTIILKKNNANNYSGRWHHPDQPINYNIAISTKPLENQDIISESKYSGVLDDKLVYIKINHEENTLQIIERYGSLKILKVTYECNDQNCKKLSADIKGFDGVDKIEILEGEKQSYKLISFLNGNRKDINQLTLQNYISQQRKSYCDFRSMITAEYPQIGNKELDQYLSSLQLEWIKNTSLKLRTLYNIKEDVIPSERLKYQAYTWIDIELWTKDFISGIIYHQYSWQTNIEAIAFHYDISKSEELTLDNVWSKGFSPEQYAYQQGVENNHDTWLISRQSLNRVYFDIIKGVQRDVYPYKDINNYIDKGSWLDKLLKDEKIKD